MTDLNRTRNMFGPLDGELRAKLVAMLDEPSAENWDNAHSIVVGADGFTTLWQSVEATGTHLCGPVTRTDGSLVSDWSAIPTREQVEAALEFATH